MNEDAMKKYQEQATVKNVLKGGKNQGQNTLAEEILGQDQYKQEIVDGLLGVRRIKKPMETENGQIYLQEFVRLEDQSGKWYPVHAIDDDKWKELKQQGPVTEQAAKTVLTTLNGVGNNNVALSNMTQKQINNIGENMVRSIDNKLRSNRKEYGIDSAEEIEWIMDNIVVPNTVAGLSKAKGGKFIKELLTQTNLVGSLDDEEDDSDGLLGSLKGGGN